MVFERFSRDARAAVIQAQRDARGFHADDIGPQHLLLGVLQTAEGDLSATLGGYGLTIDGVRTRLAETMETSESFDADADVLRLLGIDLRAVRDAVADTFGAEAFDRAVQRTGRGSRRRGRLAFTRAAKTTLQLALREAVARKGKTICCEHIMLGILRDADPVVMDIVTESADPATLTAAVSTLLERAA
ncbi:Clp protease [Mycolicibacter virginiensis]|uniref:Clp protease n=1 Tax=Mycolicibacter virginiensis TaxID=1795032 RepID=A0A9X7IPS0_9MYCO|nr:MULTISPECIES: Clp protease N-terminal domain-containing protein [Mycolicibacter]OBJ32101.1 Clp protease [Mycolicibacter heraklionensis]PQM53232.1 Clp protease [Mycolicibacter virginiensis]